MWDVKTNRLDYVENLGMDFSGIELYVSFKTIICQLSQPYNSDIPHPYLSNKVFFFFFLRKA